MPIRSSSVESSNALASCFLASVTLASNALTSGDAFTAVLAASLVSTPPAAPLAGPASFSVETPRVLLTNSTNFSSGASKSFNCAGGFGHEGESQHLNLTIHCFHVLLCLNSRIS